jgi:HEAT repeat protein
LAACVGLGSASVLLANPSNTDWMANLVPLNYRSWFFARQNAIATGVSAAVGLAAAYTLDLMRRADMGAVAYALVFAVGLILGFISLTYLRRVSDIERPPDPVPSAREVVKQIVEPLSDRKFRPILLFTSFFVAAQLLPGNLFSAYAIVSLEMPIVLIQALILAYSLGIVVSSSFWGQVITRFGTRPALAVITVLISISVLPWLVTRPDQNTFNFIILLVGHILGGLAWGGIRVGEINLLLSNAPADRRTSYLGAGLALQALVGGLSPILGGVIVEAVNVTYSDLVSYKVVFGIALALRLLTLVPLAFVREEGSMQVSAAVRQLSRISPNSLLAARNLRSAQLERRESAIRKIGTRQYQLAADEILQALRDPSPRIRLEAVVALSKLRDPRSIGALVQYMREHPNMVEEETIEALGELGSDQALELLLEYLENSRALIRRAAARALGRMKHKGALEPLIETAGRPDDPDVRVASIKALERMQAQHAVPVLCDALYDPAPSVRSAAAEALAKLEAEEALPYLRTSLSYYTDEGTSEVAYALGVLGSLEDAPLILAEAEESASEITRTRCLLGLARLLGVEADVYALVALDDFSRDRELVNRLREPRRFSPRLNEALIKYGQGEEQEAVELLTRDKARPEFSHLGSPYVPGAFLVIALAYAVRVAPRGKRWSGQAPSLTKHIPLGQVASASRKLRRNRKRPAP